MAVISVWSIFVFILWNLYLRTKLPNYFYDRKNLCKNISVPERILVFFFLLRKYYGSRMDIFERPLSRGK
ncbi:hypothetical protein M096_4408 [Parabacteroides distasonis str. 3999B T(B) 6]|nr:hypothetical protein M096_4408 [Parabacteroides distasonis str. 3999B T(B) 6]KDS66474.1 hypothetical protein M095_2603 [Parabacteroides distasonis str. 3999B T(B) 4]